MINMALFKKDNIKIFLLVSIIIVLIITIISIVYLNKQSTLYKQNLYDSLGAIVNVALKESPEAENAIIEAIKNMDKNDIEEGRKILNLYGISEENIVGLEAIDKLIETNKNINIAIIVLGCVSIIIVFIIYLYLREKKIKNITKYLKDLQNNEFSLKIEENTEGELSELQNQIVKITMMLQKQNEIMKKDKNELIVALSDISHQIKTPITSINIMIDILKEQNVDENIKREYFHEITKQLTSINWLITVLLKLSRLDSGVVEFQKEKIDLSKLINEVKQKMAIALEIKNQVLEVNVQENSKMIGDYNWTKEAITNIVKNCIEHTGEGKKIYIDVIENTLYSQILIKDEGQGIDEKDLPYIFNRFYKGKGSSKESFGIGLALAKSIIERQGGEIKVRSKKGKGTEFKIQFFKGII